MSWSPVHTSTSTTGSGGTLTNTVTATTAGNILCVAVVVTGNGSSIETCSSVTDDKGNTYALIGPVVVTLQSNTYLAYGVQVTGGATTITAHFSGSSFAKRMHADEYNSSVGALVSNAAAFDVSTTGTGTSTTPAVSTLTPAATGELIVAVLRPQTSSTQTAGTGYTKYGGVVNGSLNTEYKLSGAATETAPWTLASSAAWAEIAAAFKEPTAGGVLVPAGFDGGMMDLRGGMRG